MFSSLFRINITQTGRKDQKIFDTVKQIINKMWEIEWRLQPKFKFKIVKALTVSNGIIP